jgi:TrpR family transcriptional regulator, trp operon repressor
VRGREELVDVFCGISGRREMRAFFDEIFTEPERRALHLRWRLMSLLSRGVPQRRIAAQLGVSLCKITRGAKVLKRRGSISRGFLSGRRR